MRENKATKKRRVLPANERKEMILDAALEIFSRHGYERSDVDAIARQAGIGKGTIYRHFPSKQKLFLALVDRGYELLKERMKLVPRLRDSLQQAFRRGMESHANFFIENPKYYRVMMLELPDYRLRIGGDIMRRHQRYIQPLVKGIKTRIKNGQIEKIDPEFAAFVLAAMSCIVVERHLRCKGDTRRKDIKTAVDLFLRGVMK
ncbi:MAG: TetR/AcrR family transcriptional regulator [candidate division Zixibacteria bacterium]|nr:TetR/AcrR family transcriptional regulator [candidate division Zixibacteria bacterium]